MCLAVPGLITDVQGDAPLQRTGRVSFSGVLRDVNLAYVPDAGVGDYVIVHVGFALSKVDQDEAAKLIEDISQIEQQGREDRSEGGKA